MRQNTWLFIARLTSSASFLTGKYEFSNDSLFLGNFEDEKKSDVFYSLIVQRYSEGIVLVVFLKYLLKEDLELNPHSSS